MRREWLPEVLGTQPATVADGLAELQIRYPAIPIVFCETRKLAEEWTYHYLAAAHTWAATEAASLHRIGLAGENVTDVPAGPEPDQATTPTPSTAEVRARANGITVPDRGRLRPEVAPGLARCPLTLTSTVPPA